MYNWQIYCCATHNMLTLQLSLKCNQYCINFHRSSLLYIFGIDLQWHCFLLPSNRVIICSILLNISRIRVVLSRLKQVEYFFIYKWNISLSRQVSHFSTHRHMNSNSSIFELTPERWVGFDKSLFFKYEKNDCVYHSQGGNLIQHTVIWSI